MSDFISTKIKELCDLSGGTGFKEIYQGSQTGDYPFIKVSDMNLSGNEKFIFTSNNWISKDIAKKLKAKLFPKDSVVFAKVGAALFLNKRRILTRETSIDNNMMAAVPKENVHPLFLYYSFLSIDFQMFAQDGALPSVNQTDVGSIQLKIPSTKKEQKKIAEILTSVDKVIELTEIEIEKLKNLKKGMMQDLLTKGIGHTKFKDSPIGKIPESWEEFEFGSLVSEKLLGITIRGEGVNSIPLVKMGNIKEGRFVYDKLEQVDESVIDSSYLLSKGDLLFNTRNTPEMTGKVAVWRGDYPIATFDNNLLRLRFDKRVNPFFMGNLLTSDAIYLKFRGLVTGSNSVAAIYWKDLSKMRLNLPPIAEQDKITDILLKIENSLEAKIIKNEKLINLKKGLMQDLLTGKVRVKV